MKIKSYSIEKNGIHGICKSPSIWGMDKHNNGIYPLVYLRKPKWMSDKSFQDIIKNIKINIPVGTEIK